MRPMVGLSTIYECQENAALAAVGEVCAAMNFLNQSDLNSAVSHSFQQVGTFLTEGIHFFTHRHNISCTKVDIAAPSCFFLCETPLTTCCSRVRKGQLWLLQ